MSTNYYLVLGVGRDATLDEIKEAYRRRAKQCHPDRRGGSHAGFLGLQEAYAVLSDPIERQTHDLAMNRKQDESQRFYRIRPGPARHPVEPLVPEAGWAPKTCRGPEPLTGPFPNQPRTGRYRGIRPVIVRFRIRRG